MRIADIMNTDVETLSPEASADHAWELMESHHIRHLVICDHSRVVGVLSQRDLGGKHGEAIRRNMQVADLMTLNPITVESSISLKEAANQLRGFSIGCIPVVEDGTLKGIVTLTDLLEQIGKGASRGAIISERRTERGRPIYRRPGHPPIS